MSTTRRTFLGTALGGVAVGLTGGFAGALGLPDIANAKAPTDANTGDALTGLFSRQAYPAYGTAFTRDASQMRMAYNSDEIALNMKDMPKRKQNIITTSVNTILDNRPIWVVDSRTPGCRFIQFDAPHWPVVEDRIWKHPDIVENCLGMIPVPRALDWPRRGDQAMAIYDQGTGMMREYFGMFIDKDTGVHNCTGAGYYQAGPGLSHLPDRNFWMQLTNGASAVVGMLTPLSQIGIAELQAGEINHAVSFTIYDGKARDICFPARGNDGQLEEENVPYEGQWFRLPQNLPISEYKPMTQLIIRALQKYGGFAADRNTWCHAFNLEWPGPYISQGTKKDSHTDPYQAGSPLFERYGGFDVDDFPWERTEWIEPGYGGTTQYPQPSQVWADNFGRLYPVGRGRGLFTGTPDANGRVSLKLERVTKAQEKAFRWADFRVRNGVPNTPRIKFQGTYKGAVRDYYKVKMYADNKEYFTPCK